jgi:HEAT repeat protein
VTGPARPERSFQQVGPRGLRTPCFATVGALVVLATSATSTVAAHRIAHADAAQADAKAAALVEKLRELPLPLRALPQGMPSAKATPPSLPALESRRQQVYDQLHALGPASVPALARALRDPDPEMRRHVAVALDVVGGGWWQFPDGGSKLDLRPALPALLSALADSDSDVRAWAAQDISDMGEGAATAVPRLRVMLHSPDPGSRGSACNALGVIGSAARGALPDLRNARNDSSPEVRQAARAAVVSIERAEALP